MSSCTLDTNFSITAYEEAAFDDYWEEWPFWNRFGPVKSILDNTDSIDNVVDVMDENNNRQDYAEIDDSNEDQDGWWIVACVTLYQNVCQLSTETPFDASEAA